MLVKTYGCAICGVDAIPITVEVSIDAGLSFTLVGLPDNAVRESRERIDSALRQCDLRIPGRRIVINMAPADIKKEGADYDLTLAIGILAANGDIPADLVGDYIIMGELSLDGGVRPISGALPIAIEARKRGCKGLILPEDNAREAGIVNQLDVHGVRHIGEVIRFFKGEQELPKTEYDTRAEFFRTLNNYPYDFAEVKGQETVKRALEIAAAGGHNVIMIGSPGSGKSMLAKRLPSILPPLTLEESLETTKIYSVAGKMSREDSLITMRPFCAPHHTSSDVALVGGGSNPKPGAISLAHNGVLFLDELPEFKRGTLEALRQPLEDRKVVISRARQTVEYPASFMLVAAMNPCPCGHYNDPTKLCTCPPGAVNRYLNKVSGPFLDRVDLQVEVMPLGPRQLTEAQPGEGSATIRERVISARNIQEARFREHPGVHCNAQMNSRMLARYCALDAASQQTMVQAMERIGLSARAYDRILKVARTIADLEGTADLQVHHLSEAIQYRSLDRSSWGNQMFHSQAQSPR